MDNSTRACEHCGEAFAGPTVRKRFCTAACRYRHRDQGNNEGRRKAKNRKDAWRRRTAKPCPICANDALGSSITCGAPLCRALHRRDRSPWPRSPICTPITPMLCEFCELPFVKRPGMNNGAFCSQRCRGMARGRQASESPLAYGACARCGKNFVRRVGSVGSFCSEKCRDKSHERRREARKRSGRASGDHFTIRDVAVRDGWRCHLCGKQVPDEPWSGHPLNATVDHLLPLSAGGTDTLPNVKLAHFKCNTLRGVGGVVQLAMV